MLSFNMSLVYNLINLIVLCLLLKKFLIGPVMDIMEKRRELIAQGLLNARNSEKEAAELKMQYEEALKNARSESTQILDSAKKRAQEESDRILRETDLLAADKIKKADKDIETERERTLAGLQSRIAEVALCAAKKVSEGYGHANEDLSLYDRFIEKAGDVYDTDNQ